MNKSTQEKNENPVVTLKAQAEKLNLSRLRADKNNKSANTGEQMYKDFQRIDLLRNGMGLIEG